MDLVECYSSACRIALQAVHTDPLTWKNLHELLPNLRKRLSCQVCHKLLDRLNPYSDGFACTGCTNEHTAEYTSCSIIQCYKKLCAYIHKSPLFDAMCTRDEDYRLVEIVTEVVGVPSLLNGHNGVVNGSECINLKTVEMDNRNNVKLNSLSNVQISIKNKMANDYSNLQMFDVLPQKQRNQNQLVHNNIIPKKKKNERRGGCRCGNATTTPGKLTCFGQRCPCYTEQKSCDGCKCRGCRNPRQKQSNNDDNVEIDQIRRKPVTLELVSSLQPSHINSTPTFTTYTMNDMLQFPSHSQNYNQNGAEVTLGQVNSIFHSP